MRKSEMAILGIVLLSFLVGIYFYARMPEKIASHWNFNGEVDGYISKFWGLFLMPFISIGLFLFFLIIPKVDPLKQNIEKFRKYFDGFVVLMTAFLFYLYLLTIFWNLGIEFDMSRFLAPAFGTLFYYLGVLCEHAKRNWFIGIRTPWTLSSDRVWEETHKFGGKLFKIIGVMTFLGIFFNPWALLFLIGAAIFIGIYTVIYSYLEYKKEKGKKELV